MVSPFNHFQAIPSAFLANLGTFRVASAKVANQNLLGFRMNMRDFSWASVDAFSAARAFFRINDDGAGVLVYAQSLERAGSNAWVIFALSA